MLRCLMMVGLLAVPALGATAGEVAGRVTMPDTCSPSISPAVVTLDPVAPLRGDQRTEALPDVKLVRQQGLQFDPRVQVARVGQPLRFTNQDAEPHSVHSASPGVSFSWSMAPNATQNYTPDHPGLIRLVCDIHTHMRGYVVVTDSPWAKVCKSGTTFRFRDVPAGRYTLNIWHELGPAYQADVTVSTEALDLGTIPLQGPAVVATTTRVAAPVVAWPEVIDRISILLGEARLLAGKPDGLAKARKLAEDAYWGEFEMSDMETAVRRHLGYARAGAIEAQLRGFRTALKAAHDDQLDSADLRTRLGDLMVELSRAANDLKRLNIFDRTNVDQPAVAASAEVVEPVGVSEQARQLTALAASFERIQQLADSGRAGEASSAMTDAYFTDFEPIERMLNVRAPQTVTPLEARFNAIRGRIDAGTGGSTLAAQLADLRVAIETTVKTANQALVGSFSPAFVASLVTILREGVEVILLLAMLIALAAKAGQPRALAAIWWGVGVAVGASGLTAYGLNLLLAASQGRTREIMEGAVMMAAAAILFYVSYWLISQTQAKRWADFLKRQAAQGAKVGGLGTLAVTSFLAVYREGAETTLMYQAMIAGQGGSRDGLLGIVAGIGLGLVLLAVIAAVIRASSVRLPIRPFFKFTGFALFAMAVIFAGNGVFELQSAGLIKVTPVTGIGLGIPLLGIHPNVQSLVIQGFLLAGALITLVLPLLDRSDKPTTAPVPSGPARVGGSV